jgi:hypothetical protein
MLKKMKVKNAVNSVICVVRIMVDNKHVFHLLTSLHVC